MINFEEEKERLTHNLSEQYSQNIINMEEYERILEYINKIETKKELTIIEKIILENNINNTELSLNKNNEIAISESTDKHLSLFSWKTSNIKPLNGNAGKYLSIFGTNRIIIDDLPVGKTVFEVKSIFGLTEIIVSENIKINNKVKPVFSGIFSPYKTNNQDEGLPELYIIGRAVFGNITIKTTSEIKSEIEYSEKLKEKIMQNIIDKI